MTINEDLEKLGIDEAYFNSVYYKLTQTYKLPDKGPVPEEQYSSIVSYLQEQGVLGPRGGVKKKALKVLKERRELEVILEDYHRTDDEDSDRRFSVSGGISPCRRPTSGGGVLPCR